MPYTEFTLELVESRFGLTVVPGAAFAESAPLPVPAWLADQLARGRAMATLASEKARSEFLVAPLLLACRELVAGPLSLYSGQRLDVDTPLQLTGECDHILALTPPVPRLRAPLVCVLEAKRGEIEPGLGQCAAQMVAARLFNERAGDESYPVYGVVTTGEAWQFLKLDGPTVSLHPARLFIDNVGGILAALQQILAGSA